MIKRLVYNKKAFKILDGFTIKQSNAEVTFNDITIDFTGYSLLDIPFKYQELKIIQAETEEEILNENGEVVFAGFLDDIDLSEMKIRKEEQRELTLTVLSPLAMSTKRYVSLIGTYSKEEAIRRVLQPLLDDGFKIVEFNIPTGQITTNFVIESVENCMNDMCFKAGVFWFIDENKNIYINSIDYLFGLGSKKTIAPDVITKGLSKIQPKIENIDYANVINFKNVRIYYSTLSMCDELNNLIEEHDYPLLNLPKKLKKGDTVQFNNPIVVSEDTLRKLREEGEVDDADVASLSIIIGGEEFYIRIETNEESADYDKYVTSNNFSFSNDGGEEKTLVLQRDRFFNNLITGFKWNGADNSVVSRIYTGTALRYTTMRFMHSAEINNLKGVISDTGIIEKCIDYQEKWTTTTQLVDYARSLMSSNTKTINQVDLTFDETPNLKIGDIVEIHEPDFYIDGKFAVKEISYKYINDENEEWNIKLKNSDLNSTYIDLFRPAQKQENESKTDTVVLSEYVEETVYEKHEIGEKETLTGEVIVVKDNDGLITIEKINGSHLQKTTQGINLYNKDTDTKGWVYSNTGILGASTVWNTSDWIEVTPNAKYCISNKTTGTSNIFISEFDSDKNFIKRNTTNPFTVSATTKYIRLSYKNDLGMYEIQLEKGNTKTTYEPYTGGKPSPSPDYPQEIETVGDNVQLLDNPFINGSANGISWIINDDGTMIIDGTTTANTGITANNFYINAKEGETVTLSATGLTNVFNVGYKNLTTGKDIFVITKDNPINTKTLTADDLKNANRFYMYIQSGKTFNNQVVKIKLEKGTKATPYSPYGQGSVEITKKNRNLFDIKQINLTSLTGYGVTITLNDDNSITINGTATDNHNFVFQNNENYYLEFFKDKTYSMLSKKISGEAIDSLSTHFVSFNKEEKMKWGFLGVTSSGNDAINKATATERMYSNYFVIYIHKGATYTNYRVKLMVLEGEYTLDTVPEYVDNQTENYIIPIQQEMLEGDYIDGTEHHEWHKLILTGTEPWYCETNGRFGYSVQHLPAAYKKTIQTSDLLGNVCNSYIEKTPAQTWRGTQGFCIDPGGSLRIWDDSYSKTSDLAGFKAMLAEKYNAGNPVVCYLKLATPIELELTDAQKAISKYLQPYDNGTTILVTDKLATITASYTKKGENDEN